MKSCSAKGGEQGENNQQPEYTNASGILTWDTLGETSPLKTVKVTKLSTFELRT